MNFNYYIAYKPFGTICQFTREGEHPTLAELGFQFPKDVYPVGRLDTDSEGLLILTNDKSVTNKLLNPRQQHQRTYWVQVDGDITEEAIEQFAYPMELNISGKQIKTLPAKASKLLDPLVTERNPPIRFRKNIPTSWVSLTLMEGKNHQVRKMTAKVGFPTLRLIRFSIEKITLEGLLPGQVKEVDGKWLYQQLRLK